MKIKNYYFIGCCLLAFAGSKAIAQTTYPTYESYMKNLRNAGDSIIANHPSVSQDKVLEQLASRSLCLLELPATKKLIKLSDSEIYKKVKPSVLIIGMMYRGPVDTLTQANLATGYVIDPSGICVTNYHVMLAYAYSPKGGKHAFIAQNGQGKTFAIAKVLWASAENDLAVFQLDLGNTKTLPCLALADKDAEIGDAVYVLGHPQGVFYHFTKGIAANLYSEHVAVLNSKAYTNRNTLAITADYGTGSSGGPVLDDKGNVIGIVSNTRAVSPDAMGRSGPQMVIKNTIPVSSLKNLLSKSN
jgi:serine protease Do